MHQPGEKRAPHSGAGLSSDWRDHALCRGAADRYCDPWDADERTPVPNATAAMICGRCPVRRRCLIEAISNDESYGIWGGLTRKQRKQLVRARKRTKCPICSDKLIHAADGSMMAVCMACGVSWRQHRPTSAGKSGR